jgi:hypothetical protein
MVKPPVKGERATLNSNLSTRLKPTFLVRVPFCHAPPPGLAFGEPDDRLRRGIKYAAASRFHQRLWNTGSPDFRLRSLSYGGQVAGDDG